MECRRIGPRRSKVAGWLPARKGTAHFSLVLVRLPAMRCKNLVAVDATCLILLDVGRPKWKSWLTTSGATSRTGSAVTALGHWTRVVRTACWPVGSGGRSVLPDLCAVLRGYRYSPGQHQQKGEIAGTYFGVLIHGFVRSAERATITRFDSR